jgi:phage terminase small subunit
MTKADAARQNGKKGGRPKKFRPGKDDATPTLPLEPRFPLPPTLDNPFSLGPKELLFVEAYCGVANFNATKAYAAAGFTGNRFKAARLLTNGHVEDAIAAKLLPRLKALQIMDGDEALEGISSMGRVDIRTLFNPTTGALLKMAEWPAATADAVKTITPNKYGTKIELYDKLRARELMAKVAGRLVERHDLKHTFTLEDIVAGTGGAPAAAPAPIQVGSGSTDGAPA